MIHEIWLFMAKSGLPLWFKQFRKSEQSVDPTLVTGLLTAIKGFSNEAIGSELTDLVLANDKLHNHLVSEDILFTVHVDNRVETGVNHKLSDLLTKYSKKINDCAKEQNITNLSKANYTEFQNLIKSFKPILNDLAIDLDYLRSELLMAFDDNTFDTSQLSMLSKISELVPFLTKNHQWDFEKNQLLEK